MAQRCHGLILFEDEASFAQWGSLSYTWARRGQQPEVPTSGKRKGYKVFGANELPRSKLRGINTVLRPANLKTQDLQTSDTFQTKQASGNLTPRD